MKPSESPMFWLLGILLTGFVGYWFRTRENRKSQLVKDLRNNIDLIYKDIEEVEKMSFEYFLMEPADEKCEQTALAIRSHIKRVGTRINVICRDSRINKRTLGNSINTRLVQFRQAITLDNFDSSTRIKLSSNSPIFEKISSASANLKSALEDIYGINC